MARIYEFKKQIPPSATDTFAPDEKNVAARRKKHIESHPDRADGALNRHAGFEPLATPLTMTSTLLIYLCESKLCSQSFLNTSR